MRRDLVIIDLFSPNTGKYGPEITPYLDTFHVVQVFQILPNKQINQVIEKQNLQLLTWKVSMKSYVQKESLSLRIGLV